MSPDEELIVEPPVLGAGPPPVEPPEGDHISIIEEQAKREKAQFLRLVLSQVQYTGFVKLTPRMKLDEFDKVRSIALIDTFLDMTNRDIMARLGVNESIVTGTRKHVHFPVVQEALVEAAVSLAAKTIDEMAKVMESSIAKEMASGALTGSLDREQLVALQEFASRTSPKPGRTSDQKGILFPPELLEIIARGVQMMPKPVDGQVIEISASRVNVPLLEEFNDEDAD